MSHLSYHTSGNLDPRELGIIRKVLKPQIIIPQRPVPQPKQKLNPPRSGPPPTKTGASPIHPANDRSHSSPPNSNSHQQEQPPQARSQKTSLSESPSNKAAGSQAKETPTQMLSCEYCEILNSSYFEEHLRTAASVLIRFFRSTSF